MYRFSIFLIFILAISFAACEKKEEPKENTSNQSTMPAENMHKVVVEESMDASNYTYMKVNENGSEYWIAVPQMSVNKGETLYFGKSMEMKNFHSETLNRDFDSILFVDHVSKTPEVTSVPNHPKLNTAKEDITVKKLPNGNTVEQIFANRDKLAGKTVSVRGKVTKFNPNIMGRNWIHIQDGTGSSNNYDLMVTSKDIVKVGDIVVVEGRVAINKDFGAGYSYPVMLEDAKVKTEKAL
jgi:hypothetical protein